MYFQGQLVEDDPTRIERWKDIVELSDVDTDTESIEIQREKEKQSMCFNIQSILNQY